MLKQHNSMTQTGTPITLPSGEVVVVSNEKIKYGDYFIDSECYINKCTNETFVASQTHRKLKKILLASPNLNLEGIPKLDMEHYNREIGIGYKCEHCSSYVNEVFARGEREKYYCSQCYLGLLGETFWLKTIEANKEKIYTREDMYMLSAFVTDFIAGRKGDFMITTPKDIADKFLLSQPLVEWDVEERLEPIIKEDRGAVVNVREEWVKVPKTNIKGFVAVTKVK